MLGDIQYKADLLDDAKDSYKEVAKLDPQNPEIWLDYSHVFTFGKDFETALDCLNEGIKEQQDNSEFVYRKFVYLIKNEQYKEAYSVLEEALIMNYTNHNQIFEYDPKLQKDDNLLRIIELYKKD